MGALLGMFVATCVLGGVRADVSARSYVQNGLIAQWDGIENAGWGVHDASAAKPVELISGIETELTGTMPASDTYFMFGSGYLRFTSETIQNAVNSGELTVEIVVKEGTAYCGNGGFIAFGSGSRGFWLYQEEKNFIGACSYHAKISGEYANFNVSAKSVKAVSFILNATACRYGFNGGVNGSQLSRFTTDMGDADCYLGTIAGKWLGTRAIAQVYSIRVYARKLSSAEIAANGEVDRARFGTSPACGDDALFVPSDAVETARSYAQEGLIAQWDGIENAGYGVHDATAAKPVELVSGLDTELTGTMPAEGKSFTLGSGHLKFTAPAVMEAINAGSATVEIVLSKNGSHVHNGGFIAFGDATRGLWLYQQSDAFCNCISYHSANASAEHSNLMCNLDGTNTLSFALADATINTWYVGGAAVGTFQRFDTDVATDADCYIGLLATGGNSYRPNAKVHAIRIYNRVLTPAEVAKNAAIDRRRFAGADVAGAASYVRSGLLAQWDGAENAGYGLHEVSSDAPVELASGYADEITHNATNRIPADGKAFVLGSGFIKFQSQEIIDALNDGHATVEMVIAPNGNYRRNGGFVAFGNNTRAFWLYQQGTWILRSVSYHAASSGSSDNGVFKDIEFNEPGTNSLSFLLSDGATATYNTNGFSCGFFPRSNVDTLNSDCFVGLLANYNTKPNAKVFSVRVYDRLLTAEELENNQLVDRLRFNARVWTEGDVPPAGSTARVVGGASTASASVDLEVLALERGGTLDLPSDVTVGAHVLLTNGVAVARGGYTGSGNRGTRVDWLAGPGLLRVAGGLGEPIPAASEFPVRGVTVIIR